MTDPYFVGADGSVRKADALEQAFNEGRSVGHMDREGECQYLRGEIERLRAALRRISQETNMSAIGVPYPTIAAKIANDALEQLGRPKSAGNCPYCAAEPGQEHTSMCGLRGVPWSPIFCADYPHCPCGEAKMTTCNWKPMND